MAGIKCVDCGVIFEMSAEEQKWYLEKGFQIPKRCPECRKNKRRNKRAKNGRKDK